MVAARGLFRTTVGKKAVMAATGIVLFGFVAGHLAGNLKLYQGRYADGPHAGEWKIDVYGEGLRELGAPVLGRGQALSVVRLVLLAAVGLHAWSAWSLTRQSWDARPIKYEKSAVVQSTYAARTMRWGGVLVLLYVIYHLLDFTFGRVNPSFIPGDVYHNVLASFRAWPVAVAYFAAMVVLGLHVYHGTWSALQTLGLNRPPTGSWRRGVAAAIALGIAGGYITIPVAVLAGIVR